MSKLNKETEVLVKNIEDQMERLVQQLADLEEFKSSMTPAEFEDMRQETRDQIVEFQASLDEFKDGDVSLMDNVSRMKMALQAAVSSAFKTPEVIRLFAKNQPALLRARLEDLRRESKLGHLSKEATIDKMGEVLMALKDLGEKLSSEEDAILSSYRLGFGGFETTEGKSVVAESVLGEIKSSLKQK